MTQGDEQWFRDKAGKFSGSRFGALMAKGRGGAPSKMRANLITQLAIERIMGTCAPTYSNQNMEDGIATEPEALEAYEDHELVVVQRVDFVQHPKFDFVGCSPDGTIGDDGLVQIKSRVAWAVHYECLRFGSHAHDNRWQLQGELWVTGRAWNDVTSYCGDFPPGLQLAIVRVERDEKAIEALETECVAANQEVIEQLAWFEKQRAFEQQRTAA